VTAPLGAALDPGAVLIALGVLRGAFAVVQPVNPALRRAEDRARLQGLAAAR
jgi:hypothetical protein